MACRRVLYVSSAVFIAVRLPCEPATTGSAASSLLSGEAALLSIVVRLPMA